MRRLSVYVRPYGWLVAAALGCLMLDGLLQLVGPLMTQRVIDVALPAARCRPGRAIGALFAASLVVAFACQYGETILTGLLGQRVMRDLRRDDLRARAAPARRVLRSESGRSARDAGDVRRRIAERAVHRGRRRGTGGSVHAARDQRVDARRPTGGSRSRRSASFPFVYLGVARLSGEGPRLVSRHSHAPRAHQRVSARADHRNARRAAVRTRRDAKRGDSTSSIAGISRRISIRSPTTRCIFRRSRVLTTIALASLIVAGARRVEVGSLTVGTVAAFLQLVRRFFQPLQDLSDKFNTLQQAMAASERVFRLLGHSGGRAETMGRPASARCARSTTTAAQRPRRARLCHRAGRCIRSSFEDVWFAYDLGHVAREDGPPASPEWVLRGRQL